MGEVGRVKEQNGHLSVPTWCGLVLWWALALGLLVYGTVLGSHLVCLWAMYLAAGAATVSVLWGQAKCRRMMAESFRLGREAAQRDARAALGGDRESGVRHLH